MLLLPGTRFAHTKTWTIDVNDYGSHYYEIYHVLRVTAKTVLLLNATLFTGDVHVNGNALMDEMLHAYHTNATILNQVTAPRRYKLETDSDGTRCFYTGLGTARECVRLNGNLNPVAYIRTPSAPTPVTPVKGKKERARSERGLTPPSCKRLTLPTLMSGPPAAVSSAELRFYREERPRVAALFSNTADQDRELKRRWDVISTEVPTVSVATDDDDATITKVRLLQPMTDVEAAECHLQLVDIEMTSDDAVYVYTPKKSGAASSSLSAATAVSSAPVASCSAKSKAVSFAASVDGDKALVGRKRSRDVETSTVAEDSPCAANIVEFMGRFRKDTLQNMCEDLAIRVSGNRPELIARIVAEM